MKLPHTSEQTIANKVDELNTGKFHKSQYHRSWYVGHPYEGNPDMESLTSEYHLHEGYTMMDFVMHWIDPGPIIDPNQYTMRFYIGSIPFYHRTWWWSNPLYGWPKNTN
ncbi:MAG: hypothetical protein HQL81_16170 [Magnetococcales bacterium]|nr:hypothetical protein [Magnetococcales bacterium]